MGAINQRIRKITCSVQSGVRMSDKHSRAQKEQTND